MSGVIDENGIQWERCNSCIQFVNIDDMLYEQPTVDFEFGRDLCPDCYYCRISPAEIRNRIKREELAIQEYEQSDEFKEFVANLEAGTWVEVSKDCWQFVPASN